MAYLAFDASGIAPVETRTPVDVPTPHADAISVANRLSALEWSVVALARADRLSSLRRPGRVAKLLRAIVKQPNPMLADDRLEALRRMAVYSWHYGYTVPSEELKAFLRAGFSTGQYETMLTGIGAAQGRGARR